MDVQDHITADKTQSGIRVGGSVIQKVVCCVFGGFSGGVLLAG